VVVVVVSRWRARENSYVHDQNAGFVEPVDDFAWRHADSRDEEARLLLDDDVDELGQVATGVIVLAKAWGSAGAPSSRTKPRTFVLRALPPTWGRSKSTPNGALGSLRSFFRALI
jgi:hypothetical protein